MVFEIPPAAVYQSNDPTFAEMPVELIARILRYLDAESLLNLVRTYQACQNVCLGAPLLSRRLKAVLKEKKKLEMERRIYPSLGVSVIRIESGKMFGQNTKKTVLTRILPRPEYLADVEKQFYRCVKKKNEEECRHQQSSLRLLWLLTIHINIWGDFKDCELVMYR